MGQAQQRTGSASNGDRVGWWLGDGQTERRSSCALLAAAGVAGALAIGCDVKAHAAGKSAVPSASPRSKSPEMRKKAPVTPQIIAASQEILVEHADAPLGSEFPIRVDGKRYVARIEEHDNESGSPGRPPGKHRGVTVYEP